MPNDYFINQERLEEMKRLNAQAQVFLNEMGLLAEAEPSNWTNIHDVLDIASGTGLWSLAFAQAHPEIQIRGIDTSKRMVHFARAQAEDLQLSNVQYELADATERFLFPDASFDLVNMQLIYGFMRNALWPKLFAECYRILRPGGMIRIIQEDLQFHTSSNALHEFSLKMTHALYKNEQAFSPTYLGLIPRLPSLLKQAQFQHIEKRMYYIDYTYQTANYSALAYDLKLGMKNSVPFIVQKGICSTEDIEEIIEQALIDTQDPCFDGFWTIASILGRKQFG